MQIATSSVPNRTDPVLDPIEKSESFVDIDELALFQTPDFERAIKNVFLSETDQEYVISNSADFSAFSISNEAIPEGFIVYTGDFDNTTRTLYIPSIYRENLLIIGDSLFNVGNTNIVGRFDSLDMSEWDIETYTLVPIGGSPQNVFRYGSFNFSTTYTRGSNNNLVSTNTYGNFSSVEMLECSDLSFDQKIHYDILFIIVLLGVLCLCWLKKLQR